MYFATEINTDAATVVRVAHATIACSCPFARSLSHIQTIFSRIITGFQYRDQYSKKKNKKKNARGRESFNYITCRVGTKFFLKLERKENRPEDELPNYNERHKQLI